MAYKSKTSWWSMVAAFFVSGSDKWTGAELDNAFEDMKDSVQWNDPVQTLTDAATVVWNYSNGGEAKVTLTGNRTLSITNLPTDRVVYGCLEVVQDATGGRTLTLPTPQYKSTIGTLLTTANAVSEITFRWNGSAFSFKVS